MIPLWMALVLAGVVGGSCWLIGDSVGYWRAVDERIKAMEKARLHVFNALGALERISVTMEDRAEVERLIDETR